MPIISLALMEFVTSGTGRRQLRHSARPTCDLSLQSAHEVFSRIVLRPIVASLWPFYYRPDCRIDVQLQRKRSARAAILLSVLAFNSKFKGTDLSATRDDRTRPNVVIIIIIIITVD